MRSEGHLALTTLAEDEFRVPAVIALEQYKHTTRRANVVSWDNRELHFGDLQPRAGVQLTELICTTNQVVRCFTRMDYSTTLLLVFETHASAVPPPHFGRG